MNDSTLTDWKQLKRQRWKTGVVIGGQPLSSFLIGFQSVPIWPDELSKRKKTSRHTANKNISNQKHIRSGVCFIYGSTQDGANLLQQQTLMISQSTSERRSWFRNPSNNKTKQQQSLQGLTKSLQGKLQVIKNHQKQGEWISSERLNPYRLKATEKTEMKNSGRHRRSDP